MTISKNHIRLVGCIILCALLVTGRFLWCSPKWAEMLVAHWGYWIMLAGTVLYAVVVICYLRGRLTLLFFKTHHVGLIVALGGAVWLQVHEPHQFKVLYDEHTLSGVARNMHYMRQSTYPWQSNIVDDGVIVIKSSLEKRPLLFSFLICCVHHLTGYRPENAFILNGCIVLLFLLLIYHLGFLHGGVSVGIIAIALWLSFPLFAQNATGGGYDLLNVFVLALLFYLAKAYIASKSDQDRDILILTAMQLANVRSESVLYLFPCAGLIIYRWCSEKDVRGSWIMVVAPLYLIIPVATNLVMVHTPTAFESGDKPYFAFQYFANNISRAVWYLFNVDQGTTNSLLFAVLGIISLILVLVTAITRRNEIEGRPQRLLLAGFIAYVSLVTLFMLNQYWAQWDDPVATRFCIPLHFAFTLGILYVLHYVSKRRTIPLKVAFAALALSIGLSASVVSFDTSSRKMMTSLESEWFLKQLSAPEYKDALVIGDTIGAIIYSHAAIYFTDAENSKWKIGECIKNGMYKKVVVLERIIRDPKTSEEVPFNAVNFMGAEEKVRIPHSGVGSVLSSSFRKETICEKTFQASVVSRISRVVAVDGPEAVPPKEYLDKGPPFESTRAQVQHLIDALP